VDNLLKTVDNLNRLWINHKKFIKNSKSTPLYMGGAFCSFEYMDFKNFCGFGGENFSFFPTSFPQSPVEKNEKQKPHIRDFYKILALYIPYI